MEFQDLLDQIQQFEKNIEEVFSASEKLQREFAPILQYIMEISDIDRLEQLRNSFDAVLKQRVVPTDNPETFIAQKLSIVVISLIRDFVQDRLSKLLE